MQPADLIGVKGDLWRRVNGIFLVFGNRRKRGDHQGTMQTPGAPDLQIAPKGHGCFYGIEVKKYDGSTRPEQKVLLDMGLSFIVRSTTDLKAVLDTLAERKKEKP